jgi:hypothetical protein
MKDFYLKSGEKVRLIEKIGDKRFLVESYMYYSGYEGDEYEDLSGTQIVVNEIFETVNHVFAKEVEFNKQRLIEINKEISDKRKELLDIKTELTINEKKRNDLNRLIIDRSQFLDCKEFIVFIKDRVMPVRREGGARGLKMSIEINLITGEQRSWVYKIYDDYNSSSDYVEKSSDILFDPTEEEITERIKERIKSGKFSATQISMTDDKYLDEAQINAKHSEILDRQMKEYNKIEAEIAAGKEKLDNLATKISTNIKWQKQEA